MGIPRKIRRFCLIGLAGPVILAGAALWGLHEFMAFRPDLAAEARLGLHRRQAVVAALDDLGLSYLQSGSGTGRLIILVHGTPGDLSAWLEYLTEPGPGLRLIAYDRPGFGLSGPEKAYPSLTDQAAALAELIRAVDGSQPILVGHSLGGPIICRTAIDHPDLVGSLVVIAGSLDPDQEVIAWYQRLARWGPISALLPQAWTNSNEELLPLKEELQKLATRLGEIRSPVAIIHGRKDRLVPVANADFLADRLTGSARVDKQILPDEDHFLIWTDPGPILRAIEGMADQMSD